MRLCTIVETYIVTSDTLWEYYYIDCKLSKDHLPCIVVEPGITLEIKTSKLNGNSRFRGIIIKGSTLKINQVTMENFIGKGAALYASDLSKVEMTNSVIRNCDAGTGKPSYKHGVVVIVAAELKISNSTIENNEGFSILYVHSPIPSQIMHSSFLGNKASSSFGIIKFIRVLRATVYNNEFIDNISKGVKDDILYCFSHTDAVCTLINLNNNLDNLNGKIKTGNTAGSNKCALFSFK